MRLHVFFILSFFFLDCQSLSLTMNRDVTQGECSTVVVPPTSESPESCKSTEENHEVAVVTIEDPSSSFFVHFRGDKKKDDSGKKFCGKPILRKKATGLDSEGNPLKKVIIIKRESPNDVRSPRDTQENNQYQNEYEAAVGGGNNGLEHSDDENKINSEEDATLALYGIGNEYENGYDNIANPDYVVRAVSGILGLYRSVRRGIVRLYSMTDSMV